MKRLLGSLIIAVLLLSIAHVGVAASSQPMTPSIEKVTFVHYAKPSSDSKPTWDDSIDNFRLIAGGVRWSDTIGYEVNPAGSGLDPEVVRSTLQTSSETWDAQTPFELFAPPALTAETTIGRDGKNRVVWGSLDPGVIAVTYLWYKPATKQIIEFDMVFNA